MKQRLQQIQEQKQIQVQRLTQQQMLVVRLLEMPLTELEQSVNAEIDDNPALETQHFEDITDDNSADNDTNIFDDNEDFEIISEREARADALDNALANIGRDDEMPESATSQREESGNADYEEITYGDSQSFYDKLKEQMVEVNLSETEHEIMEYIIGSLDNDGLLRKDTSTIADELAIYHNIDVSENNINNIIKLLQTFDPAGVGAHDLKECLLLQIIRKTPSDITDCMKHVVIQCFDDFMNKRWDKIIQQLKISEQLFDKVRTELLKLNPKPGSALGETVGRNLQQITPDFIVDTADDGTVTFSINGGNIPDLHISPDFTALLKKYQDQKGNITKSEKEALIFAKDKIDRAKGFIEAIKQRHHTLYITMKAIIEIQHRYFEDGDESDLRPMILKDIAEKTGLDRSTISRVSNMKYAQTRWGTFRLRHFFSDSLKTNDGSEMSTRKVKTALKEIIAKEDKQQPYSDDLIKDKMRDLGFPVARRTIAKYREQLGIPVARLRKR
ncbi:MAG: RNA polymerase factor sigma-54 [Prevotella sp.]